MKKLKVYLIPVLILAAMLFLASCDSGKHEHQYGSEITAAANCTARGVITYECECGDSYTEAIAPLGHDFSENTCKICNAAPTSGLEFTSSGDGTCYLSGIGTATDTDIIIPEKSPDGDTVTAIGKSALHSLPGTDRVLNITSVVIPRTVTSIGRSAFSYTSAITDIVIPKGITTIERSAFSGCQRLKEITIPSTVTCIEESVFNGCVKLASVEVEEKNSVYKNVGGVVYSKDGTALIYYPAGRTDTEFAIPSGVTTIAPDAFSSAENLKNITIPDSVVTISDRAFRGCRHLESMNIPNSVVTIGNSAFYGCFDLTSVEIPDNVTTLGESAFNSCTNLKSVKIGNGISKIQSSTFENCRYLNTLIISKSVTEIDLDSFTNCSVLRDIFYCGSESEWEKVNTLGSFDFSPEKRVYQYCEEEPQTPDVFWHYDENGTAVKW